MGAERKVAEKFSTQAVGPELRSLLGKHISPGYVSSCGVRRVFKKGVDHLVEPYRTVVKKLVEELNRVFSSRLISVVVYGSVARGDARRDSDVDVLIVVEDLPKSHFERLGVYMDAESRLDPFLEELYEKGYAITISPILKTREEAKRITPLYLDMVEDAVIVYDRDRFFEGVLLRLREILEKLGAKRVYVGKKWYWVLKEGAKYGEVIVIE